MIEPVYSWIVALSCALLLARAAAHKLAQRRELNEIVANYRIVPAGWAGIAAVVVLLSEMSAALLLIHPTTRSVGAIVAASLFLTYAAAIALNLERGRTHIDCGCVGPSQRRAIGAWMVWRNVALTIAAVLSAIPVAARPLAAIDVVTISSGVAALALVYAASDQLGANVTRMRAAT